MKKINEVVRLETEAFISKIVFGIVRIYQFPLLITGISLK